MKLSAQNCTGSSGVNLFEDGDFGRGTLNNVQSDPGLAPGYRYNRNGPPADGEYTITRNMGRWPNLYGTWLPLQDNSPDSLGYMMVVNADYAPGLFYEKIVEGLCDNTSFLFSADIINVVRGSVQNHIFPNVDFLINDRVVLSTGAIRQTERWNTYSFQFATEPGQSSLKLSLRNNAPGGIGNDLAIDNIRFSVCGPPAITSTPFVICSEELPSRIEALIEGVTPSTALRYQWQMSADSMVWEDIDSPLNSGYMLTEDWPSGYWLRFYSAGSAEAFSNPNCRFFSAASQPRLPQRIHEVFDTICGGTSTPLIAVPTGVPGLYQIDLVNIYGCDSIVLLHLDTVPRAVLNGELYSVDPSCFGFSDGIMEAINTTGGYPPYSIELSGISHPGETATNVSAGTYSVKVKDRFGCFYERNAQLNDPPEFSIAIMADAQITLGDLQVVRLQSNFPINTVEWQSPLVAFRNQTDFSFLPTSAFPISATASDDNGCESSALHVFTMDKEVNIYVPNIFSPNGDGVNDTFDIGSYGRSLDFINEFKVYDRYGNSVYDYHLNNQSMWDGTFRGDAVAEGVYYYKLEAALIDGTTIRKDGAINVTR